ncbi:hypothetical protein ACSBR2_012261 [Camellia fascicularis]
MSDYLPNELIIEILARLPVDSLLRFTSVYKSWRNVLIQIGAKFLRRLSFTRKALRYGDLLVMCAPPPHRMVEFRWSQAFMNGAINWVAYGPRRVGGFQNLIVVFNMGMETFSKMMLPRNVALDMHHDCRLNYLESHWLCFAMNKWIEFLAAYE